MYPPSPNWDFRVPAARLAAVRIVNAVPSPGEEWEIKPEKSPVSVPRRVKCSNGISCVDQPERFAVDAHGGARNNDDIRAVSGRVHLAEPSARFRISGKMASAYTHRVCGCLKK